MILKEKIFTQTKQTQNFGGAPRLVTIRNNEHARKYWAGAKSSKDFVLTKHRQRLYALQGKSAKILESIFHKKDGIIKYTHRVVHCTHRRISAENGVYVYVNKETGRAQYGNLMLCGSVWTCPKCANRITTARSAEVLQAIAKAPAFGFLTLTTPHHKGMPLGHLLDLQAKAKQEFYRSHKVRNLMKSLGVHGRITATECTWGEVNGWHPHYHALLFLDAPVDDDDVTDAQESLATEWRNACKKAGMTSLPTLEHGLDLKAITDAKAMQALADYMTKYGCMPQGERINTELTKWHTKTKVRPAGEPLTGLTPFELLAMSDPENPECPYAQLWREFAGAFKGKRQLDWSPKLKERYGIGEQSDDDIVNATDEKAEQVFEITYTVWRLICQRNERTKPLELAEQDYQDNGNRLFDYCIDVLLDYLDQCRTGGVEPCPYTMNYINDLLQISPLDIAA